MMKRGEGHYAEVLLMVAEANIGLGNTNQALKYLNQVRKRNGGDQIDGSSDVQVPLLDEWKKDLGNEGLYFSVLKRMDKAKEVLNIEDYKLLFPIPQRELDISPNPDIDSSIIRIEIIMPAYKMRALVFYILSFHLSLKLILIFFGVDNFEKLLF